MKTLAAMLFFALGSTTPGHLSNSVEPAHPAARLMAAASGGSSQVIVIKEVVYRAVVVKNQEALEGRFRYTSEGLVMDLAVEGQWVATEGAVIDEIGRETNIPQVTARFQPETGYEHRMRFLAEDGSSSPWTGWTSGPIVHTWAVPAPGQSSAGEFSVETRRSMGSPTIASSGYIRVKKLNSGG